MSLKLVKRPKSPYWTLRGTVITSSGGKRRIEESTGVADKAAAEEIRVKREAELQAERVYGKNATATFAHAAADYLEHGGNGKYLGPVLDYFRTMPLVRIDQDALDAGAKKLYPNVANSTRNRQFYTPVSSVLHHAAKRGWCSRPIIERPKQPKGCIRWN